MPIPAEVVKVVLADHAGAAEIFETGFWYTGDVPVTESDANNLAAEVASQLEGPTLTVLKSLIASDTGYDEVRVYSYVTGGSRADYIGTAPITGGGGTGGDASPLQQCMCVTLETGFAGRTARGRMFLPANGTTLDAGHIFDTVTTTAVVGAIADFFSGLNGIGTGNHVAVVSPTASVARSVVAVSTDQRPDIQRRRANREGTGTRERATVS